MSLSIILGETHSGKTILTNGLAMRPILDVCPVVKHITDVDICGDGLLDEINNLSGINNLVVDDVKLIVDSTMRSRIEESFRNIKEISDKKNINVFLVINGLRNDYDTIGVKVLAISIADNVFMCYTQHAVKSTSSGVDLNKTNCWTTLK